MFSDHAQSLIRVIDKSISMSCFVAICFVDLVFVEIYSTVNWLSVGKNRWVLDNDCAALISGGFISSPFNPHGLILCSVSFLLF